VVPVIVMSSPHHWDDRTALAYAYEGDELVAKLYKEKAVRECQQLGWLSVSMTPEGEDRLLSSSGGGGE
jgi:hypothetical protein